jgi:hypothetical protein
VPAKVRYPGTLERAVPGFRTHLVHLPSPEAEYQFAVLADLSRYHLHRVIDLRHTWASWHVQGGTPLFALQELGGWESAEMVRKYAHLAADHLAPWADRLADHNVTGTNPSQGVK